MAQTIYKTTAYERHEGTPHIFEVYKQNSDGAAPYMIALDGSFLATAESGPDIAEEIQSTIKWFDWCSTNPVFA